MTKALIEKAKEQESQQELWARMQKFTEVLNGDVESKKLQSHPVVKDCKYLPISHMEMALDEMFFGQWSTSNFRWQQISNEIAGSIDLTVVNPLTKLPITRTGAAAYQIMVDSIPEDQFKKMTKKERNTWALDSENKKPGALTNGGFAALKADCFKNACLSLGKYFGRDVNREHTAENYMPSIKDPNERKNELRTQISNLISENQDTELVAEITKEILDAEESGENTIQFYRNVIKKLKG